MEASLIALYKKSKLSVSLDQQSKMLQSLVLLYVKAEVYQNILKLGYWTPAFTLCKAFLITKKSSGTSIPNSFAVWFLKKKKKLFSHYILLTDQTSLPDGLYFLWSCGIG